MKFRLVLNQSFFYNISMNMIDYLEQYGNQTLEDLPFNAVDALILSKLSYLKWENLPFRMDLGTHLFCNLLDYKDILIENLSYQKKVKQLIEHIIQSKRYHDLRIGFVQTIFDFEQDIQFAAMVYEMDEKSYNVVYRGTDKTFTGWKEDFDLAYSPFIDGQKKALEYLNTISFSNRKLRVMGHSKGGNLATFASIFFEKKEQLINVYNFDGPGFLSDKIDPSVLKTKYHKYIPRCSLIGLLMEHSTNYTIVNSNTKFIFQHEPFTWQTYEDTFEVREELDALAISIHNIVNNWLKDASIKEREILINAIYDLFRNEGIETTKDIKLSDIPKIVNEYKNLDPTVKEILSKVIHLLVESNKKEITNKEKSKVN